MFYNGWAILIAFLLASGGIRFAERAEKQGKARGHRVWMIVMLLSGLYMLAAGLQMAVGGQNPLGADVGLSDAEDFKTWMILALSALWPYALIAMGFIAAFIPAKLLLRGKRDQMADKV